MAEEGERRRRDDAALADRIRDLLRVALGRHVPGKAVWIYGSLVKPGRYHDTLIERVTLDLKGIRPAFLPVDAVRDVRELEGFRHLFRHAYDLDLDPVRVTAATENAARCVDGFDGWCRSFLETVRRRYGDQLE